MRASLCASDALAVLRAAASTRYFLRPDGRILILDSDRQTLVLASDDRERSAMRVIERPVVPDPDSLRDGVDRSVAADFAVWGVLWSKQQAESRYILSK